MTPTEFLKLIQDIRDAEFACGYANAARGVVPAGSQVKDFARAFERWNRLQIQFEPARNRLSNLDITL